MNKKVFTLIMLCIINHIGFGQEHVSKWDLKKCIYYALSVNLEIKKSELKVKNAQLDLKIYKESKYPTASFSSNITDQSGRSLDYTTYNYTIQQLFAQNYQISGTAHIYSFGKNNNIKKSHELSFENTNIEFEKKVDEIKFKVLDAYIQVLNSNEQLKIFEIDLSQTIKQLESVKEQFLAGTNSELNYLQMKNKLNSDSANLLGYKETYMNNVLTLKSILNMDDTVKIDFENITNELTNTLPLLEVNSDVVFKNALRTFKQHKSDLLNIESAKTNIKISKASLYPTVAFNYNFATAYSEYLNSFDFNKWGKNYGKVLNNNFNQQFSLGINVPIYSNSKIRSQYKQSLLGLKDAEIQLEQNNNELKRKINSLYNSTIISLQRINATKRIVEGLSEVYEVAKSGYVTGGITSLDLINNQNALLKSKIELLNNQFNYFINLKVMEYYTSGILNIN